MGRTRDVGYYRFAIEHVVRMIAKALNSCTESNYTVVDLQTPVLSSPNTSTPIRPYLPQVHHSFNLNKSYCHPPSERLQHASKSDRRTGVIL
jgi:hypothetical protein